MTDKSRDLVKQLLLAKRSYVVGGHTKHEWVNPDGPIAADLIETQAREIARKDAALRLFLALLDDPDYDFGELCEEFVPIARAALAGDSHDPKR